MNNQIKLGSFCIECSGSFFYVQEEEPKGVIARIFPRGNRVKYKWWTNRADLMYFKNATLREFIVIEEDF